MNVLSIIIVLVSQDVQGQTTLKITSDDLPVWLRASISFQLT